LLKDGKQEKIHNFQTGSGRNPKLNKVILRKIKTNLKSKQHGSIRKTAAIVKLSNSTIVRARKKLKLKPYHIRKQPFMNENQMENRVKFAKANKNRNWREILFCDETTIDLNHHINSKNNIQYASSITEVKPIQTFKHPFKVHAVAGIAYDGKHRYFFIHQKLDSRLVC